MGKRPPLGGLQVRILFGADTGFWLELGGGGVILKHRVGARQSCKLECPDVRKLLQHMLAQFLFKRVFVVEHPTCAWKA